MHKDYSNSRVLVVDDNIMVTRALMTLLRDEGFDPIVFNAGMPAVEFARNEPIDMVLVDIHLPDISGLELARMIRQHHGEEMPIIIVSGDTSMTMLRSLSSAGATYFFSKPVSKTHLLNCLHQCKGWRSQASTKH